MRFTFFIEPNDIGAFAEFIARTLPRHRRVLVGVTGSIAVVFAVFAAWVASVQQSAAESVSALLVICACGAFLARHYYRAAPREFAKHHRKIFETTAAPAVLGRHSAELRDSGIYLESSGSTGELSWTSVVSAAETGTHLFIFVSPIQAVVIPRQSLEGTTWSALLDAIRAHVPVAA